MKINKDAKLAVIHPYYHCIVSMVECVVFDEVAYPKEGALVMVCICLYPCRLPERANCFPHSSQC